MFVKGINFAHSGKRVKKLNNKVNAIAWTRFVRHDRSVVIYGFESQKRERERQHLIDLTLFSQRQ